MRTIRFLFSAQSVTCFFLVLIVSFSSFAQSGSDYTIRLKPPEGLELPENLTPFVFTEDMLGSVQRYFANDSDPKPETIPLRTLGSGRFSFPKPSLSNKIFILINHPGFIRGFVLGPFTGDKFRNDELDVAIPKPAGLKISLRQAPDIEKKSTVSHCGYSIYTESIMIYDEVMKGADYEITLTDLAPGWVRVIGFTGDKANRTDRSRIEYFVEVEPFKLSADKTDEAVIRFEYSPFDPAVAEGDEGGIVNVKRLSGTPAAGLKYAVMYFDLEAGYRPVRAGTLDDKGSAVLSGLKADSTVPLSFFVEGDDRGALELQTGRTDLQFYFTLPPVVGDPAPDFVMNDIETGVPSKFSSLRGEVVFLDFWATWCAPCQKPMLENNEIMKRRANDWKGKATILAVSIDDSSSIIKKYLRRYKLKDIPVKWTNEGGTGWECEVMERYGVSGIPEALLINKEGTILWRGDPRDLDVEKAIDEAIKGEFKVKVE
jgi:thiol-disulfide isomerase/thioredoxin